MKKYKKLFFIFFLFMMVFELRPSIKPIDFRSHGRRERRYVFWDEDEHGSGLLDKFVGRVEGKQLKVPFVERIKGLDEDLLLEKLKNFVETNDIKIDQYLNNKVFKQEYSLHFFYPGREGQDSDDGSYAFLSHFLYYGFAKITKYLLEQNAIINDFDMKHGLTPFHFAVIHKELASKECVELLFERVKKKKWHRSIIEQVINQQDLVKGNAPLHFAAWNNRPDLIKLFIDNAADQFLKNNDGDTPLDLFAKNEYVSDKEKNRAKKTYALLSKKKKGILFHDRDYQKLRRAALEKIIKKAYSFLLTFQEKFKNSLTYKQILIFWEIIATSRKKQKEIKQKILIAMEDRMKKYQVVIEMFIEEEKLKEYGGKIAEEYWKLLKKQTRRTKKLHKLFKKYIYDVVAT